MFQNYFDQVVSGDFNLPNINWKTSVAPTIGSHDKFLQLFISEGLYQHVMEPTRHSNTLDLVFTNEPFLAKNVSIHPALGFSDHNMVSFSLGISPPLSLPPRSVRNWDDADLIGLSISLDVTNWPDLFKSCCTVNDLWVVFRNHSSELIQKFVPLKRFNQFSKKSKYPNNIKRLLRKKRVLFSKLKNNRTPDNVLAYKKCCKHCNKEITLYKRNAEMKLLSRPNGKKFYSYINSRLKSCAKISCLVDNDDVVNSDVDCANILNNQFASVFIHDDGNLPNLAVRCINVIEDFIITRKSIIDCIKHLKSNSSAGPDSLPSKFFKHFADQLSIPLQTIFSRSFDEGKLPVDWKFATIVPIFKNKGKATDPINYRPISLTCICCKLMERLLKNNIYSHLVNNNAITNHQHGFVSKKSTQTQLLECTNVWFIWLDEKEGVDVVYKDVSKAFDTVSHPKLLNKLASYGIQGKFLNWVRDFLAARTQAVKINSSSSDRLPVTSGVPQGSVLGPLLYLIYSNDIIDVLNNCFVKIFADDCKFYLMTKLLPNHLLFIEDIAKIFGWYDANQLRISLEKCLILQLGRYNPRREYTANAIKLNPVQRVKDLGVLISNDLEFSENCSVISKKAFQKSALIYKTFSYKSRNFLMALYKTYVRPQLEYCSAIWSPHLLKDINLVESVQRRFTKSLPGLSHVSYRQRLQCLNLESLEYHRLCCDLVQCHKIVYSLDGLNFNDFLN